MNDDDIDRRLERLGTGIGDQAPPITLNEIMARANRRPGGSPYDLNDADKPRRRLEPRRLVAVAASIVAFFATAIGVALVRHDDDGTSTADRRVRVSAVPVSPMDTHTDSTVGHLDRQILLPAAYVSLGVATEAERIESLLLTRAEEEDVASCMVAAGWEYIAGDSVVEAVEGDPRYAMPADEFAEEYGLGITVSPLRRQLDPNERYRESLANSALEDYRADLRLCELPELPTLIDLPAVAEDVALALRGLVNQDPVVTSEVQRWRECMSAYGLQFTSPSAMAASFRDRAARVDRNELDQLAEEEVDVARADVRCRPPYMAAVRAAVPKVLDEYRALVEAELFES